MDLLRTIQFNLDNLAFSIRYDGWDLSPDQQSRMLMKVDEIQGELNKAKEKRKQQ